MKIYLSDIKDETQTFQETITFDLSNYKLDYLKDLSPINVNLKTRKISEQLFSISLNIKGKATLISAIKLDLIDYDISLNEDLLFTNSLELEDVDIIYFEGNYIDLDNIIYSLIMTSLPYNIKGKNEEANISGEGYRIISEDQYNKEQKSKGNAFDKLKDLDL